MNSKKYIYLLVTTLLFLIVKSQASPSYNNSRLCHKIIGKALEYSSKDFPLYLLNKGLTHNFYSEWAARYANQVTHEILNLPIETFNFEEQLYFIERSRSKLALQTGEHTPTQLKFGIRRLDGPTYNDLMYLDATPHIDGDRILKNAILYRMIQLGATITTNSYRSLVVKDNPFENDPVGNIPFLQNSLQTAGLQVISEAPSLQFRYYKARIWHPQKVEDIQQMLSVADLELKKILKKKKRKTLASKKQFWTAAFHYYIAMPYMRGSAGIGNVFFAGFYAAIFGEKLSIPAEADTLAMILSLEDYILAMTDPETLTRKMEQSFLKQNMSGLFE